MPDRLQEGCNLFYSSYHDLGEKSNSGSSSPSPAYYDGDSDQLRYWDGYDAIAQTRAAQRYIRERRSRNPFLLVLSWGPPHNP
jgi:hypothetical protein